MNQVATMPPSSGEGDYALTMLRGKESRNELYKLADNQPDTKNVRPRIHRLSEKQLRNFWKRVKKTRGCWKWTGGHNSSGRAAIKLYGVQMVAPRVSYAVHNQVDPGQWDVLHTCDNPSCVKPQHMKLGIPLDNASDRENKDRGNQPRGESHGLSKLTDDQIIEIRNAPSSRGLAKKYGVVRQIIWRIRTGKRWTHVN